MADPASGLAPARALVTGAAGFIGAALSRRLLADGHAVTLLAGPETDLWRVAELRGEAEIVAVDLRDPDAVVAVLGRVRPELVFHLAAHGAYSWQRSLPRMIETNVTGIANLVEAAARSGVRAVVNAGSSSEYGLKDHAPPEHELPEPNSSYAVTKAAATLYCGWVARTRAQAITTLRLYSAYGPWEEPRRLVPTLVAHGLEGRLPPLVDPAIARDFVYVEDILDAFLLAAEHAQPGGGAVYNVGSGAQTTLRELVDAARRVLEIAQEPAWGSFPARHWDTDVWVADPRRIEADLGWRARTSIEEGLTATARWLAERADLAERYCQTGATPAA
jgi:nucleoside-diphosphate-sugar epimerase